VTKHEDNGNISMGSITITITTPTLRTSSQSPISNLLFNVTKRFNNPYKRPTIQPKRKCSDKVGFDSQTNCHITNNIN